MTSSRRSRRDQGPGVSLFPFLAVLLCTMGMLIMLLVLIGRDTADRDAGETVARTETAPTAPVSDEDDLFSEKALDDFSVLSASRMNSPPKRPAEKPAAESPNPSPDPSPKESTPDETEKSENRPSEPPTGEKQSETPEEKTDEEALYEEYLRLYGEMTPDEIESQRESAEWFLSELKGVRDRTEKELTAQRTKLAESEAEIGKMVSQLIELNAKALALTKDPQTDGNSDAEGINEEIEKKVQEIAALSAEIERLRQKGEESGKKPTYAILPYRGKSGTFRRPIYVECDGKGIRLMPENVPFLPEDFLVARYPGNPFDAGLRAARQYYVEKGEGDAQNEPYPLLILRPEAAQQYYVAKAALASWGGEFGYEFVESDSQIEYPNPDSELRKRVEEQVAMARVRLAGPLAALMNELEANGQLGPEIGFSGNAESGARGANGAGAAGAVENPSAAGKGSGQMADAGGMREADGMRNASGIGVMSEKGGVSDKGGVRIASQLGPYARIDEASNAHDHAAEEGSGPPFDSGNETAVPFEAGTNSSEAQIADLGDDFPSWDDYWEAPSQEGYAWESGGETGASGEASENGMSDNLSGGGGNFAQGTAPYSSPENGAVPLFAETSISTDPKNRNQTAAVDPATTVGNTAFLQGNEGEKTPGTNADAAETVSGKIDPKKEPAEPKVKSEPDRRAIHLAEEFRKPSQMAIERPITLECHADRILFIQQAGLREARSIPYAPDSGGDQAVLETIVFCVRSWNVAGRNMFWSPWVKAKVAPGGEETFQRLSRLMETQKVRMDRVP